MDFISVFATAIIFVLLIGALLYLASRYWSLQLEVQRREYRRHFDLQQQRISELENRLMTNTWQDFAAIQQSAPTAVDKTIGGEQALQSFGGLRPDESYGEMPEDDFMAEMQRRGVDLEGPTLGGG